MNSSKKIIPLFGLGAALLSSSALANNNGITTTIVKHDPNAAITIANSAPAFTTNAGNTVATKEYVPLEPNAPYNINHHLNRIENANEKTLGSLLTKWRSNDQPIVIAHFGDSHIQTGWQVGAIRKAFQQERGNAGRGMIFPYSIAKTYSQEDYTSSFTGTWKTSNSIYQPPKIGVGISGFVATTQSAHAQVNFAFSKSSQELGNVQAKLLFRALNGSYNITMSNDYTSQTKTVDSQFGDPTQEIVFDLPNSSKDLKITIEKNGSSNSTFEFHGLDLRNPNSKNGVVYHNLGVGGAAYTALLQQKFFEEQFANLKADLVVLDWGTNDVIYTNKIADNFESNVRKTIRKVRSINPNAAIVLPSVQEARFKGRNITVSEDYEALMRRIALEEGCLYYDWYNISGGHNSVNLWKDLGFASKDTIHLNGKGYRVRAQLFANAMLSTLDAYK